MFVPFASLVVSTLAVPFAFAAEELVKLESKLDVKTVEKKYTDFLKKKGIKIFSVIDHSKAATEAKLELEATKVVIFGNPKVGTKLMSKNRSIALDLPMRTLIYSSGGATTLAYRPFSSTLATHGIENSKVEKKISGLLKAAAKHATGSKK